MRAMLIAGFLAIIGSAGNAHADWSFDGIKVPQMTTPNLPEPGPFQRELGKEIAVGAAGGAVAGGVFGSFAGPAGTAAGAAGGAASGAVAGGVTFTIKNHAKKKWGW